MSLIKKYLLIVMFSVVYLSCSNINDSFTKGYDKNPNDPTGASIKSAFIGAQTASIIYLEGRPAQFSAMWMRQVRGADKTWVARNQYIIDSSHFTTMFSVPYVIILPNLRDVVSKAQENGGMENLIAVSNIFEALVMGTTASLWGDIPYTDLNSDQPAYDKQEDVFDNLQNLLDDAITMLEAHKNNLQQGIDVFSYNGDADKWINMAYTLKARLYMEVRNYAAAETNALKGIMDKTGSGDLEIPHGDVYAGNANQFHHFLIGVTDGFYDAQNIVSVPLLENRSLRAGTDEIGRLDYYYSADRSTLNAEAGFKIDQSYPLVTAVENLLMLAEINARKTTPAGDAAAIDYLNEAREYNQLKFSASTYAPLSLTDFEPGGSHDDISLLQEIFDETYLSTAFQIVSFTFGRRIGFEISGLTPYTGTQFPERFLYSAAELNTNVNTPKLPSGALFIPTPVNENR